MQSPRVNRRIRIPQVRVINDDGEQLGVIPTSEALALAEERGLDLVEVS
ncbi:MAG: translation initiation factor IF-3, partial [Candidatus Eisenbacteria bacterium]